MSSSSKARTRSLLAYPLTSLTLHLSLCALCWPRVNVVVVDRPQGPATTETRRPTRTGVNKGTRGQLVEGVGATKTVSRVLPVPRSHFSDRPWRRGWTCGKEHPARRSHTQNADIAQASKQTTGNGSRHICAHHVRASSSNVNRSSAGVESMRRPLSAFRPHVETKLDDATRRVTGIRCLQAGHSKCTDPPPPPSPPSGRGSQQMGAGWRPFQPQCTTCV